MIYTLEELRALGIKVGKGTKVTRSVQFFSTDVEIGENCRIDHGTVITGRVRIGNRVHLAPYCILYGKAGIDIGNYSGFGAFTVIHSESDDYSGLSMFGPCVPDDFQPCKERKPVWIGRNVLTGTRVTIMPGVTLHDGACIGAHSLVKRTCDPDTIYAGVPAKRIKDRQVEIWALTRNFELGMDP
jgi:acetyltransferase-like isoleucine patch superfamily enzyme